MTRKTDDGKLLLEAILVDGNGDEIEIVGGKLSVGLVDPLPVSLPEDPLPVSLTLAFGSDEYVRTISNAHQRIHAKKSWTAHFTNAVTNINEQTVIAFNAPPSNEIHMVITVESTHSADVYLYRDTSIDEDEGTEMVATCRNQIAPLGVATITSIQAVPLAGSVTTLNEAQATDANITTTTELDHLVLLGGEGPKAIGAAKSGRETEEWVFSDGVQVAIVLNANTNDDATHILRIDFYEEQ